MSKRCAKCEKAVYPIEELKCLDKVWHKTCFRCWECGMTLNMKNYKGYDKKPYCNAHYPTTKFTQVAVTPEIARIAQNTKLQSQLQYHSDFEQQKGKCISVTDDPEMNRLREATRKTSLLQYHSEFEKDKGKYTQVADDPETLRAMANTKKSSLVKYHEDFERMKGMKTSVVDDPETMRHRQNTSIVSNVEYHGLKKRQEDQETKRSLVDKDNLPLTQRRPPGSVGEMAPHVAEEENAPSPYSARSAGSSTMYNSQGKAEPVNAPRSKVGSIADYDPMNDNFGSITGSFAPSVSQGQQWQETAPAPQHHRDQPHYPASQPPPPPAPQQSSKPVYKAMYDYDAADDDEISFRDGDIIINPEPIDDGWMYGTVQRTGQTGMLPANYVELVN